MRSEIGSLIQTSISMKKLVFLEPEQDFEEPVLERNGKRDELNRAKSYVGLVFQCLLFIVLPVACF